MNHFKGASFIFTLFPEVSVATRPDSIGTLLRLYIERLKTEEIGLQSNITCPHPNLVLIYHLNRLKEDGNLERRIRIH